VTQKFLVFFFKFIKASLH